MKTSNGTSFALKYILEHLLVGLYCGTGLILNYYQDQNNAPLQFQIARTGAVMLVCTARYL